MNDQHKSVPLLTVSFALLICAVVVANVWLTFGSLVFSLIIPELARTRSENTEVRWLSFLPELVSLLLIGCGLYLLLEDGHSIWSRYGTVLCCVGVPGCLGAFPYPRLKRKSETKATSAENTKQSGQLSALIIDLIPCAIAAMFIRKLVITGTWEEVDLAVIAVVSLFLLFTTAGCLLSVAHLELRCRLSGYILFAHCSFVTVLEGWVKMSPERDWSESSNLPAPEILFWGLMILEFTAIVWFRMGQKIDQQQNSDNIATQLAGSLNEYAAVCNLAALPMTPLCVGRFLLLVSFLLPQQRSLVTHVAEPHLGFYCLALAILFAEIVIGLAQMKFIEETFIQRGASLEFSQDTA